MVAPRGRVGTRIRGRTGRGRALGGRGGGPAGQPRCPETTSAGGLQAHRVEGAPGLITSADPDRCLARTLLMLAPEQCNCLTTFTSWTWICRSVSPSIVSPTRQIIEAKLGPVLEDEDAIFRVAMSAHELLGTRRSTPPTGKRAWSFGDPARRGRHRPRRRDQQLDPASTSASWALLRRDERRQGRDGALLLPDAAERQGGALSAWAWPGSGPRGRWTSRSTSSASVSKSWRQASSPLGPADGPATNRPGDLARTPIRIGASEFQSNGVDV